MPPPLKTALQDASLSKAHFRGMFEQSPIACQIVAPDGSIVYVNRAFQKLWGISDETVANQLLTTYNLLTDSQFAALGLLPYLQRALAGESVDFPLVRYSPEETRIAGRPRSVRAYAYPVKNAAGQVEEVILLQEDVTDQQQLEESLRKAVVHYELLTQAAPVGIFETDLKGDGLYVNQRWCDMAGIEANQAQGAGWKAGLHPDDVAPVSELWYDTARKGAVFKHEFRFMRPDGAITWVYAQAVPKKDQEGQIIGYVGTTTDISERKKYEETLRRKAAMDDLTGLPNRATALEYLVQAIIDAKNAGLYAVLMFVDLDNFKHINDSFGHHVGDRLLKQCSERLRNSVHENFKVARFGGDEFLIVMPSVDKIEVAEAVARRVIEAFEKPFFLEKGDVFITASIGVAVYPTDSCDADSLLRYADTAMYRAKEAGRNTCCFFMQRMNKQIQKRVELETELRYALDRRELVVLYQPIIDSHTGELFSVEALMRWRNAKLGMIPADQFIPLAEEIGLITPIGNWLLHNACKDVQQWMEQTGRTLRVAVNVSSRQFIGESMIDSVKSALASSKLPSDCLDLELTERLLVSEEAGKTLHLLRDAGIHISIDDFGTGYSSLNYLTTLPVSFLKVDRSFIQNVPDHAKRSTLARSVIELSHGLGLKVIGEGVETVEQLHFLQQAGCDYVQGYYISPAQPIELLRTWRLS